MDPWKYASRWLQAAPIDDEVDRRNAPVMQLLLLFYALLLPLNWAWRLGSGGEISESRMLILGIDMLVSVLALVSIWMIRRGRFRPAVMLFLAMQLISLELVFFRTGVLSQVIDPAPTMLTLVISGLVLGRRALWIAYALLLGVFATGFASDAAKAVHRGVPLGAALVNVPAVLISYSIITIILDRSIQALRESLAESNQRGLRLQHEMAERERAQARLVHAQKMETTGRLASGISHDFNNIPGVILGYAAQRREIPELYAQEARDRAWEHALEGVEAAAVRGAAITRKLLSFTRHDTARPEVFDAAQALRELRPMLRQLFPHTTRVELPDASAGFPVELDRNEFDMMVLNIAANARDAMATGGSFRIGLQHRDEDRVELSLADDGIGMSPALQERIFEPFFTTKPAMDGTGLGLAVIRELVEAAGGDIRVESTPGAGSIFRIRLPLAQPTAAGPQVAS